MSDALEAIRGAIWLVFAIFVSIFILQASREIGGSFIPIDMLINILAVTFWVVVISVFVVLLAQVIESSFD